MLDGEVSLETVARVRPRRHNGVAKLRSQTVRVGRVGRDNRFERSGLQPNGRAHRASTADRRGLRRPSLRAAPRASTQAVLERPHLELRHRSPPTRLDNTHCLS